MPGSAPVVPLQSLSRCNASFCFQLSQAEIGQRSNPSVFHALVRWQHPERGVVPPLEFIDPAERTGMIVALGELVIMKACAQIAAWRAGSVRLAPVSVNVSPRQFSEKSLGPVMSVIAQGVKTPAELRVLQQPGCDGIQGYLASRPAPAGEAALLMERRYLFPRRATA